MFLIFILFNIPSHGTFSIVAMDPETSEWGVAVASRVLDVGYVVPWLKAEVGAVATQAYSNPYFGPWALKALSEGKNAAEALKIILEKDTIPEALFTTPLGEDTFNPECLAPGKEGEIISRKGAVVDREKFERMKDEYYQLRGWDVASGLQTKAQLEGLGLQDIAEDLGQRGLVV